MDFRKFILALAGIAFGAVAALAAAAPDHVDIPADNVTLHGTLYRPEGDGPFPAVVAMHDCGGLIRRPAMQAQLYNEWANLLVGKGFVVLFPDSFGSRGLGPQCREANRKVHARRERVADANAARRWLQAQSFVKADHVTLIGWATGGISALWTVRRRAALPKDDTADFRSAVAFYPGCRRLDNAAWSARVPTLILIGAADDQTSAQVCQRMVAGARGRSAGTSIVVYPGTYHDFDHPDRPLQVRGGYAFATDSSGKIHSGTNPVARADALKRVPQWLAR
jgi:dienelactone hydrolase